MARVTSKSILMTLTFKACQADAAIGKPPMREAARSRPDAPVSLLNNHLAAKASTIKMPEIAVSRLRFFGSLSNLTDACQGVLYDFDKGTKRNLSVWCLF